jgi:hypothetical protein
MSRKKPHARPSPKPVRSIAASIALVSAVALGAAAIWLTHADAPASAPAAAAATAKAEPSTARAETRPSPVAPVNAMPTSDQTPQVASPATHSPSATPQAAAAPAAGGAGQQAFIDPRTGKLRPAEHDEVAAAGGAAKTSRLARTAAVEPQTVYGPDGSVGVVVPEELQPYTVATKAPDGSITLQDAMGPTAAATLVRDASKKSVAAKKGLVQKKEERNDR